MILLDFLSVIIGALCVLFWIVGAHLVIIHSDDEIELLKYRFIVRDVDKYSRPPSWKLIIVLVYCGPIISVTSIFWELKIYYSNNIEHKVINFLKDEKEK